MYVSSPVFSVGPAYPAQSLKHLLAPGGIDPQTATDTVQFGRMFKADDRRWEEAGIGPRLGRVGKVGRFMVVSGGGAMLLAWLGFIGITGVEAVAEAREGNQSVSTTEVLDQKDPVGLLSPEAESKISDLLGDTMSLGTIVGITGMPIFFYGDRWSSRRKLRRK